MEDAGMVNRPPVIMEPIRVQLDAAELGDLRRRLAASRLIPEDDSRWERGAPRSWLADLLTGWQRFDTGAFQARLDQLTHLTASVDGQVIHLVHALGRGPAPLPLLLTHGWPSSFCEYLDILPLLTDPGAHGGDAFTVVAPSLPGFGFSGPPPAAGLTADAVAGLWHRLMTEGLGYSRDRKSTRLNSSHVRISYAVFC